jgi:antitoxin ParD1/3/4
MNVSLTPELGRFVAEKVESGRYTSASEVVREALRLLQEHEQSRTAQLAAFNRELQARLDSLDRGEHVMAEESKAELRRKSQERREAQAAGQNLTPQEARRRLAELGGTMPDLNDIPRRRPKF